MEVVAEGSLADAQRRVDALRALRHDNIVRALDVVPFSDPVSGKPKAAVASDYVEPSAWARHVIAGYIALTETSLRAVLCASLQALAYLHERKIFCGVIHPSDIVVYGAPTAPVVKLLVPAVTTCEKNLRYASPERINGGDPTASADLWSLAAVSLQLFTGESPWSRYIGDDDNPDSVRDALRALFAAKVFNADAAVSRELSDLRPLLVQMFAADPRSRPSARALLDELLGSTVPCDDVSHDPVEATAAIPAQEPLRNSAASPATELVVSVTARVERSASQPERSPTTVPSAYASAYGANPPADAPTWREVRPPLFLGSTASTNSRQYVMVTRTGKKYHHFSCHYLRDGSTELSTTDPLLRRYTPCSVCGGLPFDSREHR
jgi:serine/threonine protein kinase